MSGVYYATVIQKSLISCLMVMRPSNPTVQWNASVVKKKRWFVLADK